MPCAIWTAAVLGLLLVSRQAAAADRPGPGTTPATTVDAANPESPAAEPANGARPTRLSEWEIKFEEGISAKEYARQLDFFHIELGAEDAKGQVQYASRLSANRPERRLGQIRDDARVSIRWKKGTLVGVDRKLLGKANINTQGKTIIHFYPREVENELYVLEQAAAGTERNNIVRTRFRVREKKSGEGYEFFVDEQELKTDKPATGSSAYRPATAAPNNIDR